MPAHPYIKYPSPGAKPRVTGLEPWRVHELCAAYGWPIGLAGGGKIAIVELGGAYLPSDTATFCDGNAVPKPLVKHGYLDGAAQTTMEDDASGEVALDVQVAAAAYSVATGKPADITIYWAKDIAHAVAQAAKDGCDVCSISWGSDEMEWGLAGVREMEAIAISATMTSGMTIFAAAGDNDSSDGGPTPANVDAPASCPHVIGCGGTRLLHGSFATPQARERVWNNNPGNADGEGTGGGFSTVFRPLATWQAGSPNGPGRMVPDVAANADPDTGYNIVVNGRWQTVGGTSAVAPLYAGLFAAFGKKLGWITPKLWLNHMAFNDITVGDNGSYRARPGPDACTGLGSPIGTKLAALFGAK